MSTTSGTSTDLSSLTATVLRDGLRRGAWSVESVLESLFARIDTRDAVVLAWSHIDRPLVLARARALDALPPDRRGPLHGVPIGIKDIILTEDQPTQYNSPLYQGFHPRLDASCVAILRHAGAVIFGKTDTVELGATGRKARTHNPHRHGHTPGGSSSGSAAAVADRQVTLSLGTQTGGSMMRPASYCGTWAFKPTWGVVGNEGVRHYASSLDTLGWFARSASDLRLLNDVFDPDVDVLREPGVLSTTDLSIAIYRTPLWERADAATRDAMNTAKESLVGSGARVVDIDLGPAFDALPELQLRIMRNEGRASLLGDYRRWPDGLHPSLRDQVVNVDGTTRPQMLEAYDHAARCRATFDAIASSFDAVLVPSTTGSAPAGLENTGDFAFNGIWSLLHTPCVNVPGWRDATGLPVGLTLTGARLSDRRVLAAARAIGDHLGV